MSGKITFNRDSKFDIQLAASAIAEKRVAELLGDKKIEIKTETWQWRRTGNIAIEYRCRGRPSGISTTEADVWIHELRDDEGRTLVRLMFEVPRLKELCRVAHGQGRFRIGGGDRGEFDVILLPLNLNLWLPLMED
jgi:hypothetical protein